MQIEVLGSEFRGASRQSTLSAFESSKLINASRISD
jgi:hypothetical protein